MKGAGTPGTEISAEQLERMQEGVDDLNEQFIQAVLDGPRKPKESAVLELVRGRRRLDRPQGEADGADRPRRELRPDALPRRRPGERPGDVGQRHERHGADRRRQARRNRRHQHPPAIGGRRFKRFNGRGRRRGRSAGGHRCRFPTKGATSRKPGKGLTWVRPTRRRGPGAIGAQGRLVKELKAACPKARQRLHPRPGRSRRDVAQAKDAFLGFQAAQIRARDEELTKLKAATPESKGEGADKKKSGVGALASPAAEQQRGGAGASPTATPRPSSRASSPPR
jgi:hypothetical protein